MTTLIVTPGEMDMEIETRADGPQVTLRIRGRVTRADGGQLKRTIATLLEEGHRLFVLDFHEVSDIDSAGLGDVAAAFIAVHRPRGQIRIENPTDRPRDLLSTTELPPTVE